MLGASTAFPSEVPSPSAAAILVQRRQWKCEVRHLRDAARSWEMKGLEVGMSPVEWFGAKMRQVFLSSIVVTCYLDSQFSN